MPSKLRLPKELKSFQTVAHRRSPVQERSLAQRLNGSCIPGSGSKDTKGDVRNGVVRIEAKTTTKASFTVTREMVRKIEDAALTSSSGEVPAIVIEFIDARGKVLDSLLVMPGWAVDSLKAP